MSNINIICPVCENDVTISERDIKLVIRNKAKTGGNSLISCPECCRVLVLPNDVPVTDVELSEWIGKVDDVSCVPLLNDADITLPAGYIDNIGKKVYRPGGGGQLLEKREYMFKYGINPECALMKMNRPNIQIFRI